MLVALVGDTLSPRAHNERARVRCEEAGTAEHLRIVDGFYKGSRALRDTFDGHFAEPRQAHAMRFVWDYWHVPNQYTLHRTQAASYFEPDAFDDLTEALTEYGQKELGLRSISPPWLSYYIDGCEQALHADVPQGPLAYVLSLTEWDARKFRGGETSIMQPAVLDYWRDFDSGRGLEYDDLFSTIEPLFNRLTVFDARLPHGVRRVEGERDPRGARLVLHGWFTEPEPFFDGGLPEAAVEAGLQAALQAAYEAVGPPCVTGLLSMRLQVEPDGGVSAIDKLVDTIVVDPGQLEAGADGEEARDGVAARIIEALSKAKFDKCDAPTQITIPFTFD